MPDGSEPAGDSETCTDRTFVVTGGHATMYRSGWRVCRVQSRRSTASPTSAGRPLPHHRPPLWSGPRGADGEHGAAANRAELHRTALSCCERTPLTCSASHMRWSRRCSVHVHTEEVTGSIPVSPTSIYAGQTPVTGGPVTGVSRCVPYVGSKWGAQDRSLLLYGWRRDGLVAHVAPAGVWPLRSLGR
jgi:hypothetical protein